MKKRRKLWLQGKNSYLNEMKNYAISNMGILEMCEDFIRILFVDGNGPSVTAG